MDKYFFIALIEEYELKQDTKFLNMDLLISKDNPINDICSKILPLIVGGKCTKIEKHNDKFYTLTTNVPCIYSEYSFNERILNLKEEKMRKILTLLIQGILLKSEVKSIIDCKIENKHYYFEVKLI